MDVDMMKSSPTEDHMDMMTTMMMLQMEKLPDFCDSFQQSNSTLQESLHFSNDTNPTTSTTILPTPPIYSPHTFMGPDPSSVTPFNNPYPPSTADKKNSMAAMREMIFRIAAMQPINIDPESIKPPKRRNVKISKDPQSVAARHRRERISERIRILQRLVPGGTKMDTASMLDEAIHYVKFLKRQVQSLEQASGNKPAGSFGFQTPVMGGGGVGYSSLVKGCQPSYHQVVGNIQMLR